MTTEKFRELIIKIIKELHLDYEDFVGYTYSDDPDVWMSNISRLLPDTYMYSKLTNDPDRMQLVEKCYAILIAAYRSLERAVC